MEPFEVKGRWWEPQQPDKKLNGILRFDPEDGARLEIFGAFPCGLESNQMGLPDIPLIHGQAITGQVFTLLNSFTSRFGVVTQTTHPRSRAIVSSLASGSRCRMKRPSMRSS